MPERYRLTAPDGTVKEIETDGPLSDLELEEVSSQLFGDILPPPQQPQREEGSFLGGAFRDLTRVGLATNPFSASFTPREDLVPETRVGQALGSFIQGATQSVTRQVQGLGTISRISPLEEFGRDLTNAVGELFPDNPEYQDEWLASKIPQMGGQLAAYAGVGGAARGFGRLASFAAISAFASMDISSIEYDRAITLGATEDDAFNTFLLNLPTGPLEAAPIGRVFRRLDTVTGGGFKRVLREGFRGGAEEAIQEVLQQTWSNAAAHVVYDQTRELFEGFTESALGGGITGFALNAALAALGARRLRATTIDEEVEIAAVEAELTPRLEVKLLPPARQQVPSIRATVSENPVSYVDPQEGLVKADDVSFTLISDMTGVLAQVTFSVNRKGQALIFNPGDLTSMSPVHTAEILARADVYAKERGLTIQTTEVVSQDAIELWENLRQQGFVIERNPTLVLIESPGTFYTAEQTQETQSFGRETVNEPPTIDRSVTNIPENKTRLIGEGEGNRETVVGKGEDLFGTQDGTAAYRLLQSPPVETFEVGRDRVPASSTIEPMIGPVKMQQSVTRRREVPYVPPAIVETEANPDSHTMAMGIPSMGEVTLIKKFWQWLQPRTTSHKGLGQKTFRRKVEAEGMMQAEFRIAGQNMRAVETELVKDYGDLNSVPADVWESMDSVLRGGVATVPLSNKVYDGLVTMRQHIDNLSRAGINEGLFRGALEAKVAANLGFYLHRSYQAKERPSWWRENIPAADRAKAEAFIRAELANKMGAPPTDAQVNNRIDEILSDKETWGGFGEAADTDFGAALSRKDIPPEIRALLGEVKNPLTNYARTIKAVSSQVAYGRFTQELINTGKGSLFFAITDPAIPEGYNAKLSFSKSHPLSELNGYYTTPAMAEALKLNFTKKKLGQINRMWSTAVLGSKSAKTIWNPGSYPRNLMGGGFFLAAQGHPLNFKALLKGVKLATGELRAHAGDAVLEAKIDRGIRLGLFDGEINSTMVLELMNDLDYRGEGKGLFPRLSRANRALGETYRMLDNIMRLALFEAEMASYSKTKFGKSMPEAELERHVAGIVQQVYQDYRHLPELAQLMRRSPVFGSFVSFTVETFRTGVNTYRIAATELRNPDLAKIGARRMAGALSVHLGALYATSLLRGMFGVTPEDDEAIRTLAAPWDKRGNLLHLGRSREGNPRFINLDRIDPFGILRGPITNIINNPDDERTALEATWQALETMFGSVLEPEIIVKNAFYALHGAKENGAPIYRESDTLGDKLAKGLAFFLTQSFEPGAITQAANLYSAIDPPMSGYRRKVPYELGAFVGVRVTEADPVFGLSLKAREYARMSRDARGAYSSAFRRGEEDLAGAYSSATDNYLDELSEMNAAVLAAYQIGLSPSQVRILLTEAGLSKAESRRVMLGIPHMIDPIPD